jgi:Tfp pilus assembly protein PilN
MGTGKLSVRRTSINLASQPFVDYRGFVLTAGALGLAALIFTTFLLVAGFVAWRETTTTQGQLRALESQGARLAAEQRRLEEELRRPGNFEQLEQVYLVNQLIERKAFSWTQLFFDLQERLPAQVRVLSITPAQRPDGRVAVDMRLGAATQTALIDFLKALEQGQKFREVTLYSQGESRGRGDAIDARVSTVYVGD